MVALTEQLALSRARADSMADVRSLNLWGNGLTEVWTPEEGADCVRIRHKKNRCMESQRMPMRSSILLSFRNGKCSSPA